MTRVMVAFVVGALIGWVIAMGIYLTVTYLTVGSL